MHDLQHVWGGDLSFAKSGDLQTVSGPHLTQQRLYRRFMTNLGEYIWQPSYGAGIPQFVGRTLHEDTIRAIAIEQVSLEPSVAAVPEPIITVSADGDGGTVFLRISYTDADTGEQHELSYGLGG